MQPLEIVVHATELPSIRTRCVPCGKIDLKSSLIDRRPLASVTKFFPHVGVICYNRQKRQTPTPPESA